MLKLIVPAILVLISANIHAADLDVVQKDVAVIASPGTPGTLAVFGDKAFVVADGPESKSSRVPIIAAATFGKGHAIAFGHDGYLSPEALNQADTGALFLNLIKWSAGDKPRILTAGLPKTALWLKDKGFDASDVRTDGWQTELQKHTVIILPPGAVRKEADVTALSTFVKAGGNIIVGNTGWGWLSLNTGKTLANDLPVNQLLAPMGIAFADGDSGKDKGIAGIKISKPMPEMLHAKTALKLLSEVSNKKADAQLLRDRKADVAQASETVLAACRVMPPGAALMGDIKLLAQDDKNLQQPTPAKGLKATDALARVILAYQFQQMAAAPVEQTKAHAAAGFFPGAVPADAKRISKNITIDTAIGRWHSLGLYAAPGDKITLTVPQSAAGKGLKLRIGSHTDKTWHLTTWHRVPDMSRSFKVDQVTTVGANAFGGIVYIEVPGNSALGKIEVTIGGAVEAPLYVLGKTSAQDWKQIRNAPGPWAELASDKLIITLKSDAVRNLENPEAVMQHWNKVLDACATLAAWPIERKSPERMVSDVDISAGYMHSGYPIMTGMDVTTHFADLKKLNSVDSAWGFYHELGHNHQSSDWTFDGTTEVTVNLFTMYVLETVCGIDKDAASSRALKDGKKIAAYLANPDFEKWKSDPFLALAMYAQLRHAFGWEPFKEVFAEYRALPANQKPRTELDKHDQWMVRMSKRVNKNLGPFFVKWSVPTTDAARKSIENLPAWQAQ